MPTPAIGVLVLTGVLARPVRGTVLRPTGGVLSVNGTQGALRPVTLAPSTGSLALVGQQGSSSRRTPAVGALALASVAGTMVQGLARPSVGTLALGGGVSSVVRSSLVQPAAGTLALVGVASALRPGVARQPGTGTLALVPSSPAWPDVPQQAAPVVPLAPGQFFPTRFTVDASLELPSDQYTADVAGSDVYQQAHATDRVSLRAGDGGPVIDDGSIDDYILTVEPTRITGSIRGRDPMARLLDTQVNQIYQSGPPPEVVSGEVTVPIAYGLFLASGIAAYVVQRAGLALSWECPDYVIHESFNAVGRPIDVLLQLVRPFSLREARKVDVFLDSGTVICRQRSLPVPVAPAVNTFAARDLRIKSLRLRKFRTDRIGHLTLRGMRLDAAPMANLGADDPLGAAPLAGGTLHLLNHTMVPIPAGSLATPTAQLADETVLVSVVTGLGVLLGVGTVTLPDGSTLLLAMPSSPAPAFRPGDAQTIRTTDVVQDDAGREVGRVVAVSTYRMPDKLLVSAITETYASALTGFFFGTSGLITRSVITTTWEPSIYGPDGPVNQPLKLREQTDSVQGHPDKVTQQRSLTIQAYDSLRLLTMTTQTQWKAELDASPGAELIIVGQVDLPLAPSQLVVTRYQDQGPEFYAIYVDTFAWERGAATNQFHWVWQAAQSGVSIASGTRPGGIRSGGASGAGGSGTPPVVAKVTWNDPAAMTWPTALTALQDNPPPGTPTPQLDARANMEGTFVYAPPAGTVLLPGDNQPLTVVFTPANTAIDPVAVTVHVTVKPADVEIRWTPPSALAAGTLLDPALTATAVDTTLAHTAVPGTFAYSPGAGTVLNLALIAPNKGGWQPATVYAAGDLVSPTAQVGGHLYVCTSPGTSGASDPFGAADVAAGVMVNDNTVVWREESDRLTVTAFFTPDQSTSTTKTVTRQIRITPVGSTLIMPEIRWTPGALTNGLPIDPALNATAVTPDPAHLPVAGTFAYTPPPGTIANASLITASEGAWQPNTIYASGDSVTPTAGGLRFRCTVPGTSGATEPIWPGTGLSIADNSIVWIEQSTDATLTAFFTPDLTAVYKSATATRQVTIAGIGPGGLIEPEIRWTPPSTLAVGTLVDAALNATAVTPDAAHLPIAGVFTYAPGPGSRVTPDLVTASKGAWTAGTVYASGDSVIGSGRIWRVSTPGTSGGTEPVWAAAVGTVVDNTVVWADASTTLVFTAFFQPDTPLVYKSATATRSVQIGLTGSNLLTPEIRWTPPGSLTVGDVLSLSATAVTPDDAHLPVSGTFDFSPPSGTVIALGLVQASKGTRLPSTVYASGDTVQEGVLIFACTEPGTTDSGASPLVGITAPGAIVPDRTVVWTERSDSMTVTATFTPDDPSTYKAATATRQVRILPVPVTPPKPPKNPNAPDQFAQVDLIIDPDPTAPPLSYSDGNLDQATLDLIARQLVAGVSGAWQHEATFTGVNVPWLHRGSPMAIVELHDERGGLIALPPSFLVQSLQLTHDESSSAVSVTRQIKALAWTPP